MNGELRVSLFENKALPMSSNTTLSPLGACWGPGWPPPPPRAVCLGLAYSMEWTSEEKTVSLMTEGLWWVLPPLELTGPPRGRGGGVSVAVGDPRALKLVVEPFSDE